MTWRSTARSTTWPWRGDARSTCRRGSSSRRAFPSPTCAASPQSMADAATAAGVCIVTGDTKVVQRGKADGCYINTAGIGVSTRDVSLGAARARPGDAVIVSGPVGDHGITIMLARGELDIESDLRSDTAPLNGLIAGLLDAVPGVRAMRDATRGGVATILNEIARAAEVGVAGRRGRCPGASGGARRVRAAGHRPALRRLRGPPGSGGGRAMPPTPRWPPCAPTRSASRQRSSARSSRTSRGSSGSRRRSAAPGSSTCWSATRSRASAKGRAASWRRAATARRTARECSPGT